jgi:hypothetical protein
MAYAATREAAMAAFREHDGIIELPERPLRVVLLF